MDIYGEAFKSGVEPLTVYEVLQDVMAYTNEPKSRWYSIVYRWAKGERIPRLDHALTIAAAVGVPLEKMVPPPIAHSA